MCEAVLFDFDDTLVDTKGSKIPAIVEYCRTIHGVDVSLEQVSRLWGIPFLQMMRELTHAQDIRIERYLEISERHTLLSFPDSCHTLRALTQRVPIGIVTSLARTVLLHSLAALNWDLQWFSVIVTEDDVDAHKPDPRVFEPALRALRISDERRQQVVYVGDSLSDGKAAISAGLRFVGVARETDGARLFEVEGWQWRSSLEEIRRIVMPDDFLG